jgi:hypothetical protein
VVVAVTGKGEHTGFQDSAALLGATIRRILEEHEATRSSARDFALEVLTAVDDTRRRLESMDDVLPKHRALFALYVTELNELADTSSRVWDGDESYELGGRFGASMRRVIRLGDAEG